MGHPLLPGHCGGRCFTEAAMGQWDMIDSIVGRNLCEWGILPMFLSL